MPVNLMKNFLSFIYAPALIYNWFLKLYEVFAKLCDLGGHSYLDEKCSPCLCLPPVWCTKQLLKYGLTLMRTNLVYVLNADWLLAPTCIGHTGVPIWQLYSWPKQPYISRPIPKIKANKHYMLALFKQSNIGIMYIFLFLSWEKLSICKWQKSCCCCVIGKPITHFEHNQNVFFFCHLSRVKSLQDSGGAAFVYDWQPPLIFVRFTSNFLCMCST